MAAISGNSSVQFTDSPHHSVRLTAGLTIYDEGLAKGRFIGRDTNLFEQHPDWVATREGEPLFVGEKHGQLDLTKPEVAAWMESEIVRLIQQYDLDLFRLDYNVLYLHEGGQTIRDGFVENFFWRYYEALYAIFERIRKRFPHVILQQCSGGGGGNDLGIISRFHEAYLTDGLFVPRALKCLNAMTLAFPPEIFVIFIGLPGLYYHRGSLDSQLRTSIMLSHPFIGGVAPDVARLTPDRRQHYSHYIELYKNFVRPMLPTSRVFHHSPITSRGVSNDWLVLEYASADSAQALAMIYRLEGATNDEYRFTPRGLSAQRNYRVTFDNSGESITATGAALKQEGLTVRVEPVFSSGLLLFESI